MSHKTYKLKSDFCLTNDALQEECRGRCRLDPDSRTPKLENTNHDASRCVDYLLTQPGTRQNERNFLITEEEK